ncbi:hypothetical protein DFH08DRAFT_384946 [Mycena albidolilacea]|uniref:Uncharacterized protein n=1 Tax=Mycena albidolilacea TaxID=1033008 RepID=A0AAD6ZFV2_9AGAR|nr:hypothetical protein DFH08DRAFT_384946 [Mycena albidolilacea]
MPLSADPSCTATPFQPTFAASVSILSLAVHIHLHTLSCRLSVSRVLCCCIGFAVARRHGYESRRGPPPSFHPLVAATTSIALGFPRWAYPPVSPSPPHIPVALATPRRYHNPTTYDIEPHTIYRRVPPSTPMRSRRRKLPSTSRPSVLLRTRVPADRVSSME